MAISSPTVLECLDLLENPGAEALDLAESASCRQVIQEALADVSLDLDDRETVADRLNHANHLFELQSVVPEESY
jgi:hypothetical protein